MVCTLFNKPMGGVTPATKKRNPLGQSRPCKKMNWDGLSIARAMVVIRQGGLCCGRLLRRCPSQRCPSVDHLPVAGVSRMEWPQTARLNGGQWLVRATAVSVVARKVYMLFNVNSDTGLHRAWSCAALLIGCDTVQGLDESSAACTADALPISQDGGSCSFGKPVTAARD